MVSGQSESSSCHRPGCSDGGGGGGGGGGDRDGEGTLGTGLSSDSAHPPLASNQSYVSFVYFHVVSLRTKNWKLPCQCNVSYVLMLNYFQG